MANGRELTGSRSLLSLDHPRMLQTSLWEEFNPTKAAINMKDTNLGQRLPSDTNCCRILGALLQPNRSPNQGCSPPET